jgi:hypothetical protein
VGRFEMTGAARADGDHSHRLELLS